MAESCDLLLRAGAVLTPDVIAGGRSLPGCVAVRGGRIVGIGGDEAASQWRADREIDLGTATLSPGFVDAHIHPILGLEMTRGVDLSGIRDREHARTVLAAYAAGHPGEPWLLGWGLDPAALDGVFDNTLLDGIAQDRPTYLTLFDGHGALVSDAALAVAGVTGAEEFEDASHVGVHPDGRPTGVLFEHSAQELVLAHVPALSFDERTAGLLALLRAMSASGLVAGQMLDLGAPDSLDLLVAAEEAGDLAIRLRISPWIMPGYADADLERLAALQGSGGRRWHVRGVKLMIDGTIDNGTAWLSEPDTHGESTDSLWLDTDEYRRALAFFHERGIPTTTHAIGDEGISFVARSLAALRPNGTQHRIEHIETLPDRVLAEIVASGAAASMQPTHCTLYSRADHSDNWSQRLGRERADLAWRIGDLRDAGVTVALGSDWCIAPFDPREIFAAAQLRRNAGAVGEEPIHAEQGLSARRALEGYTTQYWASVGEEGGRLEVGARADLTAFAHDPLTTDPDVFATTEVVLTVVDGEVVTEAVGVRG